MNKRSVRFCGTPISLVRISEATGIGVPHLSLIFAHKRNPSLDTAEKIAEAMCMRLDEFVSRLREKP
jgi:DNA-binding phage protein